MSATARSRSTSGLISLADRDAPDEAFSSPTKVGPMSKGVVAEMLRKAAVGERIDVRAPESRVVPKMTKAAPDPSAPMPSLWFAEDEAIFEPTIVEVEARPARAARTVPRRPPPLPTAAIRNAVPPPAPPAPLPPLPVERYLKIASPAVATAPTIVMAPAFVLAPILAPPARRVGWWLFGGIVASVVAAASMGSALYFLLT